MSKNRTRVLTYAIQPFGYGMSLSAPMCSAAGWLPTGALVVSTRLPRPFVQYLRLVDVLNIPTAVNMTI